MSAALRSAAIRAEPLAYGRVMTADEFGSWPGDGFHRLHALIDGQPVAMNPPSFRHGEINGRLIGRLEPHLRATRPECRVAVEVGVQPRAGAETNVRIPDLVIACGPQTQRYTRDPLVLVEILSPSNESETREAVRAYLSIPSLQEVLILDSLMVRAEVIRRNEDGSWPADPLLIGPEGDVVLTSLGFSCPLGSLYPAD